ncbi:MAG: hypothetical protein ACR2I1_01895 [Propionibacteriaceae bacterium]
MSDDEGKWFYCLEHKTVEPYGACKSTSRLGPYDTREQAEGALAKVARRNKQWDAEDGDWGED